MTVTLHPGAVRSGRLARDLSRRRVALDPACRAADRGRRRGRRGASSRKGEPVYGINTGFGKLASVRIGTADLATLQRNIVLSHAAGVGEPLAGPVVRLVMALKLASLAQGASGVRWSTIEHLTACLKANLIPVIPGARLGRRVRRSRAARPHDGGAAWASANSSSTARAFLPPAALAEAGLHAARARPEGGSGAAQRHAGLDRAGARRPVRGRARVPGRARHRRALDRCRQGLRRRRSMSASRSCGAIAARSRWPPRLRALMQGSAIRASHLTDDDRVQDPYCLRCQPQVMGAVLDLLRQAAETLGTEANGVSDNPLDVRRRRAKSFRRQFPCRAGGLRGRHDRHGAVRDRLARRAPHRHAGRSCAVRPAGLPHAEARAQFGLHDPAGDGGRARLREQAARLSGERRFDPDLRQPGGPRLHGRPWRAPAAADGGECRRRASASNCSPPPRAAISMRRCGRASALERARALLRAKVPHLDDDRHMAPDMERADRSCAHRGALADAAGGDVLPCVTDEVRA